MQWLRTYKPSQLSSGGGQLCPSAVQRVVTIHDAAQPGVLSVQVKARLCHVTGRDADFAVGEVHIGVFVGRQRRLAG
jgi:hypothetical protein